MKRYTERALHNYIHSHSKWGPAKREERLCFFALALCGESGELANIVKKVWRKDFGSMRKGFLRNRQKLVSEAADIGAYAMMFLDLLSGGKLPQEVWTKFKEVEGRAKYQAALKKRVAKVKEPKPMLRSIDGRKTFDGPTWISVVRKWCKDLRASGANSFVLGQIYAAGSSLSYAAGSTNKHVYPKIRQTLQELRDKHELKFFKGKRRGSYEIL